MSDLIERQAVLDWLNDEWDRMALSVFDGIRALPSAQPERLTDDDFETIRIHLNAYKEKLCNQQRWKEAEEYQRIIDRFMAFASAQPEIIRCKDCKWWSNDEYRECSSPNYDNVHVTPAGFYCGYAERRTDG